MDKAGAFLAQAKSDFKIFERLWELDAADVPTCHALQHLQMSTEKLAKAILLYLGPEGPDVGTIDKSHVAFSKIMQILTRGDVARKLGYSDRPDQFKRFVRRNKSLFRDIEQLCPSIGTEGTGGSANGSNVEYPWRERDEDQNEVWRVPTEYVFPITAELRSRDGVGFIKLIEKLLDRVPWAIM